MAEWMREGPYSVGPNSTAYPDRLIQIMSDADALKNNLRWAAAAVTEAKGAVRVAGSNNKVWDNLRTLGGVFICVPRMRSESDAKTRGKYGVELIAEVAAAARKHGCGNCAELSAIAFIYLYDRRITVTLDRMAIDGGDHMFVLIDRAKGDVTNPDTWGPRCVVVDPWKDQVMPASQIERLGQDKKYISDWREAAA